MDKLGNRLLDFLLGRCILLRNHCPCSSLNGHRIWSLECIKVSICARGASARNGRATARREGGNDDGGSNDGAGNDDGAVNDDGRGEDDVII